MNSKLKVAAELVGDHLEEVLSMFSPGARIGIAVWYPGKPGRDFILHHPEAKLEDFIATLERRRDGEDTVRGRTIGTPEGNG
jgi:hypothetical protein